MKISYRQAASDDVVRQFRYYPVTLNVPEVAVRFRDAIRVTVESLRQHPFLGPLYPLRNPQLQICGSGRSKDSRQSAFITL